MSDINQYFLVPHSTILVEFMFNIRENNTRFLLYSQCTYIPNYYWPLIYYLVLEFLYKFSSYSPDIKYLSTLNIINWIMKSTLKNNITYTFLIIIYRKKIHKNSHIKFTFPCSYSYILLKIWVPKIQVISTLLQTHYFMRVAPFGHLKVRFGVWYNCGRRSFFVQSVRRATFLECGSCVINIGRFRQ